MASPQCENGYTRIANEIMEALIRADLSGHSFRIALLVIRKTYGFLKVDDLISLSQMARMSGLSKSRCSQIINLLEDRKIITVSDYSNGLTKKYRFNKDFETWKTVSENCYRSRKVIQKGIRKVIPQKKVTKEIYCPNSAELRTAELLLSLIRQRNPGFKQPDIQKWAGHVSKMIRLDKRSPEDVWKVVCWCQADSFWQNNILSTEKLRRQYDAREFINQFPGELPVFLMPAKLKANSLEWLRERILEALAKYGVKFVFIDHLHYLFDLARMRNTSIEIGQVIRTLKTMAIELNITIFLMCHMAKLDPHTEPSDDGIRDSSFISQESDCVIMLWRDVKTENEAWAKICFHRRTGVLEKKIRLAKVNGLLQEAANV